MKIKIKQGEEHNGKPLYWFTVRAKNGKIRATSETYTRKESCMNSAKEMVNEIMDGKVEIIDETK